MSTMVNPIDFGGHSLKVKVTMVIIDKYGVRGDATLCVVIIFFGSIPGYEVKFLMCFDIFLELVI